jgi:hypothetical protein
MRWRAFGCALSMRSAGARDPAGRILMWPGVRDAQGGPGRPRTDDPFLVREVLYQLSYRPG